MERTKKIAKVVGAIVGYFGVTLVLSLILYVMNISNESINTVAMVFISLFSTGFVIYCVRDKLKEQFDDLKGNFGKILLSSLKYWVIGYILMVIANAIVITLTGGIAPNQSANQDMMDANLIYSIVAMCICAPIAEELLFRLNFRDLFENERTFLIVTSLIFGAMHLVGTTERLVDILFILPYSVLGYTLGTAYVKNDNIFASILMHAIHNTVAVLIMIFLV